MTEDDIERIAARRMDNLDRRYLSTDMTEADYDREVRAIDAWASARLSGIERRMVARGLNY